MRWLDAEERPRNCLLQSVLLGFFRLLSGQGLTHWLYDCTTLGNVFCLRQPAPLDQRVDRRDHDQCQDGGRHHAANHRHGDAAHDLGSSAMRPEDRHQARRMHLIADCKLLGHDGGYALAVGGVDDDIRRRRQALEGEDDGGVLGRRFGRGGGEWRKQRRRTRAADDSGRGGDFFGM